MIISARIEDVKELNQLVNKAYRGEDSLKGWASEADLFDGSRTDEKAIEDIINTPGHVILKCVDNNRIIGCVALQPEESKLYLGMLAVDPALQGSGIGKKLLQAAEQRAREQKRTALYMTVITLRHELVAWYTRHGYLDTGIRKPFDNNDPRHGIPKAKIELAILEKAV